MNNEFKDYYKVLGVTPRASFENIRSAVEHELSQNWNNAIGRLEIQEAYEILSDSEKRKEYDLEFNKRLNEREMAIRNARTFEEYIAATSLHSELANVDVGPEVTVPQEEMSETKINNESVGNNSAASETVEEKEQEDTIDSSVDSGSSESSSEDTEFSKDAEEDVQENIVEHEYQEQELEEEKIQEEKEEQQVEQNQILDQEVAKDQTQEHQEQEHEFINIPIKRIEKEIEQNKTNESVKTSKQEIQDEPIISRAALKEIIRAAIIAGGVGVGALVIGGVPGVVIGLMAGVATGDFFKKHAKLERKPSFQKESKPLEIKEINTEETKFFNDYAENLENEIYNLLDKPSKNYELEIAIRKYENLIELTKKRISFKISEAQKNYSVFKKMEIKSLRDKLDRLNKTLNQLKDKKVNQTNKKEPKLSKINQELSDISNKVIKIQNDPEKEEIRDDLNLKKAKLIGKRDVKANRLYVNKNFISFGQVTLVKINSTINIVKSTVNKFIDSDSQEVVEESSTKTM